MEAKSLPLSRFHATVFVLSCFLVYPCLLSAQNFILQSSTNWIFSHYWSQFLVLFFSYHSSKDSLNKSCFIDWDHLTSMRYNYYQLSHNENTIKQYCLGSEEWHSLRYILCFKFWIYFRYPLFPFKNNEGSKTSLLFNNSLYCRDQRFFAPP